MKDVISMNLKGKTIVLGITGGIAAYKMPNVAHALVKLGASTTWHMSALPTPPT